MKKALIAVAFLAGAVYVASWFWAGDSVKHASEQPWPTGLGTLASVPGRYPPHPENEAAHKLTQLAGKIDASDAVTTYMRQEIARGELTISEPPPIADISAARELLLREAPVWKRDTSRDHGGLLDHVAMVRSLTRNLVANALARARKQEPGAWDDLHAAWILTKSIDEHPATVLRVVEMSMARAINAVAWKMPPPAPPWFKELQERDFVQALLETMQYENWFGRQHQLFPLKPFADKIERERMLAAVLARTTACEFDRVPETGDRGNPMGRLDIGWQRAFRYRAEREATANALRVRSGQAIDERSQCSDGRWVFDGKMLKFTRPIPLPEQRDTSMPLTLTLRE